MIEKFKLQKLQLEQALYYANVIEYCDDKIEAASHVNHFKQERTKAIEKYADAVAQIIESSIDVAETFEKTKKSISDNLLDMIGSITKQYATINRINLK